MPQLFLDANAHLPMNPKAVQAFVYFNKSLAGHGHAMASSAPGGTNNTFDGSGSTNSAGSHTHTINSTGAHTHTISGGDNETAPKNVAVNYFIFVGV